MTSPIPDNLDNFLSAWCGDGTGYVSISHTSDSHLKSLSSKFFPADDIEAIKKHLATLGGMQVVFNFARLAKVKPTGRGKSADVSAFSLIGMDCDIASAKKPNKNLPSNIDEAISAMESLTLPPSIYVNSGSGLHCYWKFAEDAHVADAEDLKKAKVMVANFYRGVAEELPQFQFDSTQDLARSFRMPGSVNLKDINNPLQVTIREIHNRSYTLNDIHEMGVPTVGKQRPIQISNVSSDDLTQSIDMNLMSSGCNWVASALKNPGFASHDTWWAMASLFSKVENGRKLFHDWSKQHPDYDPSETDAKFDQVDPDKADRTCVGLSGLDGGKSCRTCVYKGGVSSPIELGIPRFRSVIVNGAQLRDKTASLWAGVHVNNSPPRLFNFEGRIARVNENEARIEVLDAVTARYEFARVVDWVASTGKGWGNAVNPEITMINDALSTPTPPLPPVTQVVSIPVVTASGRLVVKQGLDSESGIFYAPSMKCLPHINLEATKEDALASVKWINEEVLCDFPFEDDASRAAAISMTILPFARELVKGTTPFYLIDKPSAGTGATTLAKALTYPFLGTEIAVKSWTSTEDERRKQITAHLDSGGGPYFFDNLSGKIDSDVLASVLTSTVWSDRLLQTSCNVQLTNRSIWIGTGNNPHFRKQILRRIARIRLVTLVEDPSERTGWRHPDLLDWIAEHRTEFVEHILTIVIAWLNAGKPLFSGKPLNSYESWSKVMGGILEFVDMPGFLENLKDMAESLDDEGDMAREFIKEWWREYEGSAKTPTDVVSDFSACDATAHWDAPSRTGQVTKAGSWLASMKDRVFTVDGVTVKVSHSGRKYYLKEVKPEAA
jgi:hypothetical protein